jgi:hypothetical protein
MKEIKSKIDQILDKKVTRKKFLQVLGISAAAIPLLSPSVAAKFFLRQTDGNLIDVDDFAPDGGKPKGIEGSIQFKQGDVLGANSNLVWNIQENRLGIGTATPTEQLDVAGKIRMRTQIAGGDGPEIVATKGYVDSAASSAATWGLIAGTLSNQTDLQAALNLKANDNEVVKLTGNQTISGTKTFSTTPLTLNAATAVLNFSNTTGVKTISTGGTTHLNLAPGGNVGIGTTNPSFKLDVRLGTTGTSMIVGEGGNTSLALGTYNELPSVTQAIVGRAKGSGSGIFANNGALILSSRPTQSQPIGLFTNSLERVRITGEGNVGIGTTDPGRKLDVEGDIGLSRNNRIYFFEPSTKANRAYIESNTSGDFNGLSFSTASTTNALVIKDTGNIGIGTTNPSEKLHTVGNVEIDGILGVDGNIGATGYVDALGSFRINTTTVIDSSRNIVNAVAGTFTGTVTAATPTAGTHLATKAYVDSAAGGGVGSGTTGQTLRHNGTNWVANSTIYNDGTNVGIGTTTPNRKLDVSGPISSTQVQQYRQGTNFGTWRDDASIYNLPGGRLSNRNPYFLMDTVGDKGTTYPIGWSRYNNAGGSTLTAEILVNDAAPSPSGKIMRINYTGGGSTSPGFGGFILSHNKVDNEITGFGQYKKGTRFTYIIWAKIPVGRSIAAASNAIGTGGRHGDWLTSTAGTGNWERYVRVATVGETGTFSSTGHFHITGGADVAFSWEVASGQVIMVDEESPDAMSYLNIGYKNELPLNWGQLATTSSTYLATDGGNVGIGTTNPSTPLHVIGAGTFTGTVTAATPTAGSHLATKDYVDSAASGAATWGLIAGTLSNQTDLQAALNLKANDNEVVKLTGNQTISGTKTFSTIPVLPASDPTTANQAVRKAYVDAQISGVPQGTVTSVGLSAPTGFSVSGSPITTNGTLNLSFTAGYSLPTTTSQTNWDTAYGWGNHAGNYVDNVVIAKGTADYNSTTPRAGFYRMTGGANGPLGTEHTTMIQALQSTGNYGGQIVIRTSDTAPEIHFRSIGTSWSPWRKVWSSEDFTTTSVSNWNTAFTERRQWDGGSTNLNATTGRASLDVPTRTGGDASGTWGISITGNAATVTNGVYTTGNQTIGGTKTFSGTLIVNNGQPQFWRSASSAYQRVDARDDGADEAALHWYGVSSGGATRQFKHNWYNGSSYVTLRAITNNISIQGNAALHAGNYNTYAPTLTGTGASGTWGINITGNSTGSSMFTSRGSIASADLDTQTFTGFSTVSYSGFSKQLWQVNSGGSVGTTQHEYDYNIPVRGWRVRNRTDNTTWSSWGWVVMTTANQGHISGTILHSNNYNTYAPTLTGGGASGSWNINAATVTNGVYTTGNQTIGGTKTFSTIPVLPATNPTTDNEAVRKAYVDSVAASSGGSAAWGGITGTLSSQTDLQNALNLKANDADTVKLTGTQTIAGIKTFSERLNITSGGDTSYNITQTDANTSLIIGTNGTNNRGYIKIWGNTAGVYGVVQMTTSNLHLDSSASGKIYLNHYASTDVVSNVNGGNLGIGTASPTSKLHVLGAGLFTGTVTASTPTAGTHLATKDYVDTQVLAAGGSATWGLIGGTLSDQTDLQNALNLKANDADTVKLTGTQTIAGTKTFSSTITGSITGNAGTVTNGVYTTGSYANPAWITSLAWSKITGAPAFLTSESDTLATVTGRGATTATKSSFTGGLVAWDETSPGTTTGGLHIGGASGTSNVGPALTFGARDASSGTNAQAGIFVRSDGSYGTRMYIATTDSYAAGSRTAVSIMSNGLVNFVRSRPTALGNIMLDAGNYNSYAPTLTGGGASGSWGIAITGNASTATTLQTARNINGTSFNGSAAITTANWGTSRTLTIGSTGKAVNGSGNVSWNLAEIGAMASAHYNGIVRQGSWSRIATTAVSSLGGSYTLALNHTRNSVVVNAVFLFTTNHSNGRTIVQLSSGNYTQVEVRLTDVDANNCHVEILDNAVGAGDHSYQIRIASLGAGSITPITSYTAGGGTVRASITSQAGGYKGDIIGNATTVTNGVYTTGNQTIGGTKTFSTIPELPASDPTTDNQAVRKAYVDAQIVSAGGSATWGLIGGTLSNQTDLQNALNLKANDADTVKLTGTQTIAGTKTFSSTITGSITGNAGTATLVTGTSGQLQRHDIRTIAPSSITAGRMQFGFTSWNNNNTAPYADFLHLRSYTDSSGGSDNLVMFNKTGIGMRIYQQTYGSATAYSTYKDIAFTDGTNASGTWGIGITGNAGTVTNGVYTTGNQTIGGTKTFSTIPVLPASNPTTDNQAVRKAYVDSVAGGGVGSGTTGQTLRHNGTSWIANSNIYNDGTNVGVGTTTPQSILDVITPANGYASFGRALSVGQWSGIHFGYRENNTNYRKSAIVFERTDNSGGGGNAAGKVHILNGPAIGAGSATLTDARITIGELGNVGIGETSPAYKLDIASADALRLGSDVTGDVLVRVGSNATHRYLQLLNDGSASGLKTGGLLVSDSYSYANPGRNDLIVKGNVGIGETSPTGILHVSGDSSLTNPESDIGLYSHFINKNAGINTGVAISLGSNNSTGVSFVAQRTGANNEHSLKIQTRDSAGTGATRMTILGNGNVGIGTTNPAQRLDVNGRIRIVNTNAELFLSGSRMHVRSEGVDSVAQFANYGMYLPITAQTAGLYVESPIEARGGLRIGNGAASGTITVGATTTNTANRLVQRDGSGNFSAGTITATLSGNASTVTNGVYTTGNQTIGGTKTFSTIPVLPASNPTTDNQAVRKAYVDSVAGGGIGSGTTGQTLRHNGTSWIANSNIYNDGTNVGIGTATPFVKTTNSRRYSKNSNKSF